MALAQGELAQRAFVEAYGYLQEHPGHFASLGLISFILGDLKWLPRGAHL
jgi:hypothetical protein